MEKDNESPEAIDAMAHKIASHVERLAGEKLTYRKTKIRKHHEPEDRDSLPDFNSDEHSLLTNLKASTDEYSR